MRSSRCAWFRDALVRMTLGTYRGLLRDLPAGRYRLSITLSQAGRTVLHATRTVRLT